MKATRLLPVHPRVCGEHLDTRDDVSHQIGSSPRLRGTQNQGIRHRREMRFIPASAGNTWAAGVICSFEPVHPRVCGEHNVSIAMPRPMDGSSPRLRGTRIDGYVNGLFRRFIPASAGNTSDRARSQDHIPVHPRVCGEHNLGSNGFSNMNGSSPRLRGTQRHFQCYHECFRFIPASAGNTLHSSLICLETPVHPRVCGEHSSRIPG